MQSLVEKYTYILEVSDKLSEIKKNIEQIDQLSTELQNAGITLTITATTDERKLSEHLFGWAVGEIGLGHKTILHRK